MKKYSALILGMTLSTSASAWVPSVQVTSTRGEGCPEGSLKPVINHWSDGFTVTLYPDAELFKLNAISGDGPKDELKTCRVEVKIIQPKQSCHRLSSSSFVVKSDLDANMLANFEPAARSPDELIFTAGPRATSGRKFHFGATALPGADSEEYENCEESTTLILGGDLNLRTRNNLPTQTSSVYVLQQNFSFKFWRTGTLP